MHAGRRAVSREKLFKTLLNGPPREVSRRILNRFPREIRGRAALPRHNLKNASSRKKKN